MKHKLYLFDFAQYCLYFVYAVLITTFVCIGFTMTSCSPQLPVFNHTNDLSGGTPKLREILKYLRKHQDKTAGSKPYSVIIFDGGQTSMRLDFELPLYSSGESVISTSVLYPVIGISDSNKVIIIQGDKVVSSDILIREFQWKNSRWIEIPLLIETRKME